MISKREVALLAAFFCLRIGCSSTKATKHTEWQTDWNVFGDRPSSEGFCAELGRRRLVHLFDLLFHPSERAARRDSQSSKGRPRLNPPRRTTPNGESGHEAPPRVDRHRRHSATHDARDSGRLTGGQGRGCQSIQGRRAWSHTVLRPARARGEAGQQDAPGTKRTPLNRSKEPSLTICKPPAAHDELTERRPWRDPEQPRPPLRLVQPGFDVSRTGEPFLKAATRNNKTFCKRE